VLLVTLEIPFFAFEKNKYFLRYPIDSESGW